MPSVLLTAFEPYEEWKENSSWLALVELTRWLEDTSHLTTRRYPVCFQAVSKRLTEDLKGEYDLVLHLGQAPGTTHIRLESIGLNVDSCGHPLVKGGPTAYQTGLDLADWQKRLSSAGIPASVSHHAGTVLCNATLYSSQHYLAENRLKSQVAFIHLPLTPAQTATQATPLPSMSSAMAAAAIATIIQGFAGE